MSELRRRAWLCREGWYYLGVLAFIVGGAVLRGVNLLVVLAGMLIAPLLLNWRLVMASLRGLEYRRRAPSRVAAGIPVSIDIEVANHRRYLSSRLLLIEDSIIAKRPLPGERPVRPSAMLAEVPPLQVSTGSYRITIPRRGRYILGPLRLSTRFPLGLVKSTMSIDMPHELLVTPHLGRLLPQWQQVLLTASHGDQERHPQQGTSEGDYYGLRPWQSGDSRRWIHWRTTAKVGVLTVRQFERRRSQDVAIVLDPYLPANPTLDDLARLELAISLVATMVADLALRGHARLLLSLASSKPQTFVGSSSQLTAGEVHDALAELAPSENPPLAEAIAELSKSDSTIRGALLVISTRDYDSTSTNIALQQPLHTGIDRARWICISDPQLKNWFTLD
ncbi:protein of unknown function DUF58 [Pirellula staleyi DSM 6068]|uniref:DUF58 domain-containing protein n=1 Tax=Pirellula staleyi (strain ATCC 27377 / DSM 6068 / ICPB 4128) TaxID=530564 RepID=D2QY39_PIRSD|nr:DUF58 domain-containing protein [Pirellula staleyi]ADB16253.1 protein of unknown function DUF58 [Pirellula staleyi DSM 6068]